VNAIRLVELDADLSRAPIAVGASEDVLGRMAMAVGVGGLKVVLIVLGLGFETGDGEGPDADRALKAAASASVAFALQVAAGNFKKTAGTVKGNDLFGNTSIASNLLAVFAVQEVFERVEAVVRPWGSGIECVVFIVIVGVCSKR